MKVGVTLFRMESKHDLQNDIFPLYNLKQNYFLHPPVREPIRFKGPGSVQRSAVVKVAFKETT